MLSKRSQPSAKTPVDMVALPQLVLVVSVRNDFWEAELPLSTSSPVFSTRAHKQLLSAASRYEDRREEEVEA